MRGREKNNRFTLVELLIVVAIIAILAALLMPSLARARDSAKRIKCVNNLKQLGSVLHEYSIDFPSYIPPLKLVSGGSPIFDYTRELMVNGYIKSAGKTSGTALKTAAICQCTENKAMLEYYISNNGYTPENALIASQRYGTYSPNTQYAHHGGDYFKAVPLMQILKHSQCAMLGDSIGGAHHFNASTLRFVHNGIMNIVYFDNHAASLKAPNVPTSSTTDVFYTGE